MAEDTPAVDQGVQDKKPLSPDREKVVKGLFGREKKFESVDFRVKRENALESIRNGNDKEGKILYDGVHKVLTTEPGSEDPTAKSLGQLGATLESVQENRRRIKQFQEEGNIEALRPELSKMLYSINSIHGHLGLDEFSVDLEEGQGVEVLAKRAVEHTEGALTDKLTEYYMEPYLRQKIEVDEAVGKVLDEVPQDNDVDFSRFFVTRKAYPLEIAERRLGRIGTKLARKLGKDNSIVDAYHDARRERLSVEPQGESAISDEEKVELRKKSEDKFKESISGDRYAESYKNIPEEDRNGVLDRMGDTDKKIDDKKTGLEIAVKAADAKEVRKTTSDIRELQLEQKRNVSELKVIMYEQAVKDSSDKLGEALDNLGSSIANGEGRREAFRKVVSAGADRIEAGIRNIEQKIIHRLKPAVDVLRERIDKMYDWAEEKGGRFDNFVKSSFVGRSYGWVKDKFRGTTSTLKEIRTRVKVEVEKSDREIDKRFLDKAYGLNIKTKKALINLIGGVSEKAVSDEKKQGAKDKRVENLQRIHEASKQNKYYGYFDRYSDKYVKKRDPKEVDEPVPATTKDEKKESDLSKLTLEELRQEYKNRKVRPNATYMKFYEVSQKGKEPNYVLFTWDGSSIKAEFTNSQTEPIQGEEVREHQDINDKDAAEKGIDAWVNSFAENKFKVKEIDPIIDSEDQLNQDFKNHSGKFEKAKGSKSDRNRRSTVDQLEETLNTYNNFIAEDLSKLGVDENDTNLKAFQKLGDEMKGVTEKLRSIAQDNIDERTNLLNRYQALMRSRLAPYYRLKLKEMSKVGGGNNPADQDTNQETTVPGNG